MNSIWVKLRTIRTTPHFLINVYLHIGVCMMACMSACLYLYKRMYMGIFTCARVHTSMYTWIYRDTRIHVYIKCQIY